MEKIKESEMIVDGNTATAIGSYHFSEVAAIYPITPSSPMAEAVDVFSSLNNQKNVFGSYVKVVEMQSEAGAAGAVHGASQAGSLAVTYTASQGLLLMIPNIYKWVGEELPIVVHVAARSIATQALSIFGDHQDIYATRQTGIAMLCSQSVQDCANLSYVAHLIAIKSSYPIIHFFDGFRTSHEYQKVKMIDASEWEKLLDYEALKNFRKEALNPHSNPVVRGTAQNDDVYFAAREAQNHKFNDVLKAAEYYLKKASELTGINYSPFVYYGDKEAKKIIIAMGSVTETIETVVDDLNKKGEKVGVVKVYLYRPFASDLLNEIIPNSVEKIAVLDRTKEPLSTGEPLYLDVLATLSQHNRNIKVYGGRYGLSSHDTSAKDIKSVFDFLDSSNVHSNFTVGINDDVTHLSIPIDNDYSLSEIGKSCLFYGMGSDGTVSANKLAAKIIGDISQDHIQAYFQYDSKKAGGITRSHLRFGKDLIKKEYYIDSADFISCSQDSYIQRYDMLQYLKKGGTFLLNTSLDEKNIKDYLPNNIKIELIEKETQFYIVNANFMARELGLGRHTNTILESLFFYLNRDYFDYERAIEEMKKEIKKVYGKKGDEVVNQNIQALEVGIKGLKKVEIPKEWFTLKKEEENEQISNPYMDYFVKSIESFKGYSLPVSSFIKYGVEKGTIQNNSAGLQKRKIADLVPTWLKENCIQCGQCTLVCPHATIRSFLLTEEEINKLPEQERDNQIQAIGPKAKNYKYRIQVNPMNCVGCSICVSVCPGKFDPQTKTFKKALKMVDSKEEYVHQIAADYLYNHVENVKGIYPSGSMNEVSLLNPYHEVSGACAGCGETPYYRLLSQLFGKDLLIANATGCSSIYNASFPLSPFVKDKNGNGIAWGNSLFEDNAEYGYGMRISQDSKLMAVSKIINDNLNDVEEELKEILNDYLNNIKNREHVRNILPNLIELIEKSNNENIKKVLDYKDDMLDKSIWIVGGDGWAYDIGYGGLDHILASNSDVNILVLDTEVYSNTGGQASKSSQTGQIAKFAANGKKTEKKNLALLAMSYSKVYVSQVSLGANIQATIKAFKEAEEYHDGPSIVIAYSPCIEHGIKGGLSNSISVEKEAVESGYWSIFRYNPNKIIEGKNPLNFDSKEPNFDKFNDFVMAETRYSRLFVVNKENAERLLEESKEKARKRYLDIKKFGEMKISN